VPLLPPYRVEGLPDAFAALNKLQHVNLSCNAFAAVPPPLAFVTSINTLNLSGNMLKELPTPLPQLPVLATLDLSANRLRIIPDTFDDTVFPQLRHLLLYNNQLHYLPTAMAPLFAQLQTFDCSRNPLMVRRAAGPLATSLILQCRC
jgi:Leucine-rich repeat (LRR) protein